MGTHYFVMREKDDGVSGWKYDKTAWLVTVTVTAGTPPASKVSFKALVE